MKGPRSQVALAALLFVAVALVALTRAAAPSPPLGIPADWVGPWKQGDLLFGTDEPQQTYRQVPARLISHCDLARKRNHQSNPQQHEGSSSDFSTPMVVFLCWCGETPARLLC
jgi:hypothetical protein